MKTVMSDELKKSWWKGRRRLQTITLRLIPLRGTQPRSKGSGKSDRIQVNPTKSNRWRVTNGTVGRHPPAKCRRSGYELAAGTGLSG